MDEMRIEIIEVAQDIVRSSEEHFIGREIDVVIYGLLHAAVDVLQTAKGCKRSEAMATIREMMDEFDNDIS